MALSASGAVNRRFQLEPWHLNLAVLALAQGLAVMGLTFVLPFVPLFVQQDLGVADPAAAARWSSFIAAASAISMTIAQPFWGNLADRYGRKPMVVRSMIGAGIAIALLGIATAPEHLLVIRLLQGAVTGTVAASNALVSTTAPKERLGFAMGILQLAMFSGMSLGPMVGGYAADIVGARGAFYLAGGLSIAGGLLVLALARERFQRPSVKLRQPGAIAGSRALLALPFVLTILLVAFIINFSGVIVMPVMSLFIAGLQGGENAATGAGLVLGIAGAASAAAAVVLGRLGDRIGHAAILLVGIVGVAMTTIPQAYVADVWQLLALRTVSAVFLGGMVPSVNTLLARLVPVERRGSAFALSAMAGGIAAAAGPLCAAGLVSAWNLGSVFVVSGGLFAAAFLWVALQIGRHGNLLRLDEAPRAS